MRRILALLAAVVCLTVGACTSRARPGEERPGEERPVGAAEALLAELRSGRGGGILFGHQHDLSLGFTFDDGNGSDTFAAVGDYPAVFGWDALILDGEEAPGTPHAPSANAAALGELIRRADRLGGINTLTLHAPNFVTGGDFYDTSGDVVRAILPGGSHHGELTAYLDVVAEALAQAHRDDGTMIPVVLRPWHEHNGDWFWWGQPHTSPEDYASLFRFTVDYLRERHGPLLVAYSPGASLDETNYLRGYPGDGYVDVFGLDAYDDGSEPAWRADVVHELAAVVRLADEHGKLAALTEFGYYEGYQPPEGWFTDLLAALAADPDARRCVWMLTWANYGHGDREHAYVPYPAHDGWPGHPLLADFRAFHADPYSLFASDRARD